MAEATYSPAPLVVPPRPPSSLAFVGRAWGRVSSRLVPFLAILTALLVTIPFMIVTGGRGDVGRGLQIAGTAYSALIEGSLGLVFNDIVSIDDMGAVVQLANSAGETGDTFDRRDLRSFSRDLASVDELGVEQSRGYAAVLSGFTDLDDETLTELGESIPDIRAITPEGLDAVAPLAADLDALGSSDARALAESVVAEDALTPETRAAIESVALSAVTLDDATLYGQMGVINEYGVTRINRLIERLAMLRAANLDLASPEADALVTLTTLPNGIADARAAVEAVNTIEAAGITDPIELRAQVDILREMYEQNLLTNDDVIAAINTELPAATADNLVVRRPGNRLIIAPGNDSAGILWTDEVGQLSDAVGSTGTIETGAPAESITLDEQVTDAAAGETSAGEAGVTDAVSQPSTTLNPEPSVVYARLGGVAFLFFPENLEKMLVRAIPFIVAGLAVAMAFAAGMFNIGAEGQLYAGATLAIAVGVFVRGLPIFIHLPLVIIAGIIGGGLWGAIPGALKAFTGAHEVIVTIMLNYIAIFFVDWLIKSTNPVILLDETASTPRTAFLPDSARLPRMDDIPIWLFIAIGILVAAWGLYQRRNALRENWRYAVRPIVIGLTFALGGAFLVWITVTGTLHVGFLLMIAIVWFCDWFLNKTTLGFEMRTVGINPNAARYAGMSVARNIIFAMAFSGALAGIAGTIEISGVVYNMQPAFFSGLGFDAIAVALLARSNPRNMIIAGLVWGTLLAGAGLMQIRADISIDLVKIIQALIIMFIAADAIIRWIWRIPKSDEKPATMMAKGWNG